MNQSSLRKGLKTRILVIVPAAGEGVYQGPYLFTLQDHGEGSRLSSDQLIRTLKQEPSYEQKSHAHLQTRNPEDLGPQT